jgi:hypothetical protein
MASAPAPLIPQAFWFRPALNCRRVNGLPRDPRAPGLLLDLDPSCILPTLSTLEGREPWFEPRAAWNDAGLALALTAHTDALQQPTPDPADPADSSHTVQIWIDTRDTHDAHRASRFCHRFGIDLRPGRAPGSLEPRITQKNIARALAEPPRARLDAILARASILSRPTGWRLELFFKAEALNGFEPETNRRLGLLLLVSDARHGELFLGGLGREFPIGEDPSLWPKLDLID